MSLPFFLAALLGKAAVGAASKGFAAKASAAGTKGASAHHAHRALAKKVAGNVINKAGDQVVDSAASKAEVAMANRKKNKKLADQPVETGYINETATDLSSTAQ